MNLFKKFFWPKKEKKSKPLASTNTGYVSGYTPSHEPDYYAATPGFYEPSVIDSSLSNNDTPSFSGFDGGGFGGSGASSDWGSSDSSSSYDSGSSDSFSSDSGSSSSFD